jgi:hypothetical protein
MSQPSPYGQPPQSQPPAAPPHGAMNPPGPPQAQGYNPYSAPSAAGQQTPPVQEWWPTQTAETFAPCPHCGCTYAQRAKFTWWGGAVGPKLFTHVQCCHCAACYNGKHGTWNTMNIVIYSVVAFIVSIGLVLALFATWNA